MRDVWFCWEKNSRGYTPVLYYDEMPEPREPSLNPKIVFSVRLDKPEFDSSGEITRSLKDLSIQYPLPEY